MISHFTFCVRNEKVLADYLTFCQIRDGMSTGYTEIHHILPKAMFPECVNDAWNKVRLSVDDHLTAHQMLAAALNHRSQIFALNMMMKTRRLVGNFSEFREQHYKNLRQINLGRKASVETRRAMSEARFGTAIYKNATGDTKRLAVDDHGPEWIPYKCGIPHSQSTKDKIGNALRGRVLVRTNDGTANYVYDQPKPDVPDSIISKIASTRFKDKIFANNGIRQIRCISSEIPEGFVAGRMNFGENDNPFAGKKSLRSLITGETGVFDSNIDFHVNPSCKFVLESIEEKLVFASAAVASVHYGVSRNSMNTPEQHGLTKTKIKEFCADGKIWIA